uniref:Uncharacterized protein n=1 Tax=Tetranychus urticae TaxID=32264 RepID=T1K791_TETUR
MFFDSQVCVILCISTTTIDSKPAVYWDEKLDAKTNLVILTDLILKSNPIVEIELEKSLESNVGTLVQFINDYSLLTLDKTQVLNWIVRTANEYEFEGIDAKKSLHENVVIFVETGLKNIKVEDIHSFKDWVNAVIVHETEDFLSFGPEGTIQNIVAGFLDLMYISCVTKH